MMIAVLDITLLHRIRLEMDELDLFLVFYEKYFMLSLAKTNQINGSEAFKSRFRCLYMNIILFVFPVHLVTSVLIKHENNL